VGGGNCRRHQRGGQKSSRGDSRKFFAQRVKNEWARGEDAADVGHLKSFSLHAQFAYQGNRRESEFTACGDDSFTRHRIPFLCCLDNAPAETRNAAVGHARRIDGH
jgi:hypothetical protein